MWKMPSVVDASLAAVDPPAVRCVEISAGRVLYDPSIVWRKEAKAPEDDGE